MSLKNISAWSISNPIPVIVLFLSITIAGIASFLSLGIDESPNIDVPIISVAVSQMGASPSELESQVTRKVEDAVAGIGNIKHVSSSVNEGSSSTTIEFELETDVDRALNDVRNEISKIRTQLPAEIEEPVVSRLDFVGGPFVTYSISSKQRSEAELSWLIDNKISRELTSIKGVGQVQRSGGVDREIRINLDPTRLQALGITADMVSNQLRASNINLPGGRGEISAQEESIRTMGSAETTAQLAATRIILPNQRWARLDTLGTVSDSTSDQRQLALLDNEPVVGFSVVRSRGSNLVGVAESVDKAIEHMKLPSDIKVSKIRTMARFVDESYHAALDSLIIGAGLAVIVVWLFLKDWRAAGISSLAMPLSLIPTFAVMQWLGFTMNNMSLLALALVIGVLVDDAIVEIENIVRHMSTGKSPFKASLDAADEIGLAVVATTATIIVVFLPVGFMGGIVGKFLKEFGLTVAAAVFFSLVVARMLTPLIAAHFLKPIKEDHEKGSRLNDIYDSMLGWALSNRWKTVGIGAVFFIASLVMFKMMPTSVIGNVDRGESILAIEMPPGSKIEDTRRVVEHTTNLLRKRPEVEKVFAQVGTANSGRMGSGGSSGTVNKATMYISLAPRSERKLSQHEFQADIRKTLDTVPGPRMSFTAEGGITGKLKILLSGEDSEELEKTAAALSKEMRQINGLYDIRSSASLHRPEIRVEPDLARAAEQGISVQSIAKTAMIATLGDNEANLPKFNLSDRQINIRIQLDPSYRNNLNTIANLQVARSDGRLVPLSSVANVRFASGESQVERYDRSRQVTIEASLPNDLSLGEALKQVHSLKAYTSKPDSVKDVPVGDAELQKDIFQGFGVALATGVLLIYAVLVLLFGSFLHPLTIMMSLPLSLGGALIALIVSGQTLGFYALIGIVMLMGLVTKNAILLVEYTLMARHEGVPRDEAIAASGAARMRPILMTTVAMIAGMLPIALGIGAGSEARAPMALAVVGGLMTSTILTLVVVPVVFTLVDDLQNNVMGFFRRRLLADSQQTNEEATESPVPQEEDREHSHV